MAADVTRAEFEELQREVEGEKMVTRHILEQTRHNSDDLATIKTRLGRVEGRLDGVEGKLEVVSQDVRSLKATVDGLVRNLPSIVSEAVRSALPKGRSKR